MTISLHEASVGVFVPYLGNLSNLLDQASAHAGARSIDPAVLLNMRLSPTMYSLKQQVGEANRHAVVAGALLAGRAPHTFSDTEPDIAELKARISAAIDFVQGLPRAEIDAAATRSRFHFQERRPRKFPKSLLLTFAFRSSSSCHDGLRNPAPCGVVCKKDFGTAEVTLEKWRLCLAVPCEPIGHGAASAHLALHCSKRRRASLSRLSTIWIALPSTSGRRRSARNFSPMVSSHSIRHCRATVHLTRSGHRAGTVPGVAVSLVGAGATGWAEGPRALLRDRSFLAFATLSGWSECCDVARAGRSVALSHDSASDRTLSAESVSRSPSVSFLATECRELCPFAALLGYLKQMSGIRLFQGRSCSSCPPAGQGRLIAHRAANIMPSGNPACSRPAAPTRRLAGHVEHGGRGIYGADRGNMRQILRHGVEFADAQRRRAQCRHRKTSQLSKKAASEREIWKAASWAAT